MVNVQISTGSGAKHILTIDAPCTVQILRKQVEDLTKFAKDDFYIVRNGRLAHEDEVCLDGYITVVPRLFGGKGGFGSMLRAIGAQIEKTTNREACRDLSGRRLRDINEEKRLKSWIEKQVSREEEAAERKKKKLERLCAEPRHEFKDQSYERERSALTERVGDAVEVGFKAAIAGTSGVKRKLEEEAAKPKTRKTLLDFDIDSDELDSSDDSDVDEVESKKMKQTEQSSNDSGHSSDESSRISRETNKMESEYSEASSDNQVSNDNSCSTEGLAKDSAMTDTTESSQSCSLESADECLKRNAQENC